jgi:UDP-hydrolysing UDP-N-acetyl-D-glucosamine 2-epimerase
MSPRKICVVTGSRAEYGALKTLLQTLNATPNVVLQLVVTGMHLSPEFGSTYQEIETDGLTIDARVEMLLSGDTPVAIAKSIGLGVIGFADAFDRLQPDIVLLPGDRFEILAAAQAALVMRLPVAHLFGGDTTQGSFDEAIRHSLTKMSHLHFVTNEDAAARVRQLGENPENVFVVGSPTLDHINSMKMLSRDELSRDLDFVFQRKNLMITFHPVTLSVESSEKQFQALLEALSNLDDDIGIIFTKPNADPESRILIELLEEFALNNSRVKAFDSLGHLRYLSALSHVDVVVGNSSSGLCEAPFFNIPTVNIGDRQQGRLQGPSVFNCPSRANEILNTIMLALNADFSDIENPYGDGNAIPKIIKELKSVELSRELLIKKFFNPTSQITH